MIQCPNCGKMLEDSLHFCDSCGTKLPAPAPTPAPAPAPAAPAANVCPDCGEIVASGLSFCPKCGGMLAKKVKKEKPVKAEPVVNEGVCPQCGIKVEDGLSFCPQCGTMIPRGKAVKKAAPAPAPVAAPAPAPVAAPTPAAAPVAAPAPAPVATEAPEAPAAQPKAPKAPKDPNAKSFMDTLKSLPKKVYLFGGIGLAAILVIVLLVVLLTGGSKKTDYMLYVKDNQIVLNSGSKEQIVTNGLFTINLGNSNSQVAETMSMYIAQSSDGKRLFYPDRIGFDSSFGSGLPLYYRNVSNMKKDPVRLDTDVRIYAINPAGSKVIYMKSDGGLYIHDLEEKEKIANNVYGFVVSEDLKTVIYQNNENALYLWRSGEEVEKLAADIQSLEYITKDLTTVYYKKDATLYKQVIGQEERIKIAENVEDVMKIYDSGKLYYTVEHVQNYTLMDYVNDDLAAQDATTVEPEYPTYPDRPSRPYRFEFDTSDEYEEAYAKYEQDLAEYNAECDRMQAEYEEAREAWWAKQNRDSLRDNLKEWGGERSVYKLFYYNGETSTLLSETLTGSSTGMYAQNAPVMVTKAYDQKEIQKVKLSEVSSTYEVSEAVEQALYGTSKTYVVAEDTMQAMDAENASNFRIAPDGSAVCYYTNTDENGTGNLYKMAVTGNQIAAGELYDTGVSRYGFFFSDAKIGYYKNVSDSGLKGDLFVDKTEIDFDVYIEDVTCVGESVVYFADWSEGSSYGTLKVFKNGEKTKIADDVAKYTVKGEKEILYLRDYSSNYAKGTLYRYNGSKSTKIAEDVSGVITVYGNRMKGSNSTW